MVAPEREKRPTADSSGVQFLSKGGHQQGDDDDAGRYSGSLTETSTSELGLSVVAIVLAVAPAAHYGEAVVEVEVELWPLKLLPEVSTRRRARGGK
mmetsp:Transcript_17025/g.33744  ORF Transcript_17025/g.33744 Transcript_17025/m.33744 type:complete len:96 (-) Transcript_17025:900-1187(-)